MSEEQSVLLAIGAGIATILLSALGRRLPIPTAILQVLGGLLVGLVPGAEALRVSPDLVFFVFLPPVLWAAAFFTSFRDFKANLRPIGLLAVGLILVTTAAVAIAARYLFPGIPWAAAVALGAIVSPPDAIAAETILKRLPIPRRVITILQGESLVNDASALILYRGAIAALLTGIFSPGELVVRFFVDATVGILLGLLVGWLLVRAAKLTNDPVAETVLTLLGPYLAWIAGESLHVSAVLACVAGGIYVRQHFSTEVAPASRIQSYAVWNLFLFGLNSLVFLLLGTEFSHLLEAVPAETLVVVSRNGLLIAGLVIVVRLWWVPVATFLPRWVSRRRRMLEPAPHRGTLFIIAWTSMRGMVSLAAALALPRVLADGSAMPFRAEMILVTVVVIMVTLVLQGLTLLPIFTRLQLPHDPEPQLEQAHARSEARRAALEHLADLREETWVTAEVMARLESEVRLSHPHTDGGNETVEADTLRRLRLAIVNAKRRALVRLRDEEAISDEVLFSLENELDYEALRLGAGGERESSDASKR